MSDNTLELIATRQDMHAMAFNYFMMAGNTESRQKVMTQLPKTAMMLRHE